MPDSAAPSVRRPSALPPPRELPKQNPLLQQVNDAFGEFGEIFIMIARAVRALFRRPFEGREIVRQIESLGVASTGIVVITSVFIGMVMSTQFAFGLQKFGGMEYTGRVVAMSFARELAPTLTAVIVGGRIGAGMTAELGSMAVTEQIDAIQALGADPVKKLVAPRLIASIIVMPMLGAFALALGFSGAMLITDLQFGIPARFFLSSALSTVKMADFLSGLIKTPVFGAIIAAVGCHYGIKTRGGTAGVGANTTKTVVVTSITILIFDFFLTKLGILLWKFA
jgi:phospholipid/cholesterol/gamma-HCH transport system permease protein